MTHSAYFAGGCFWCITPIFRDLPGVSGVTSGYCGGDEANPVYDDVKHQRTGHRETIAIEYDPAQISFGTLMDTFLQNVDPFDDGGQFIDRGASYTLAVYYSREDERETALAKLAALPGACVAVEPFKVFWPAEEYHQDYDLKHPAEFEQELIDSRRKK